MGNGGCLGAFCVTCSPKGLSETHIFYLRVARLQAVWGKEVYECFHDKKIACAGMAQVTHTHTHNTYTHRQQHTKTPHKYTHTHTHANTHTHTHTHTLN
jgi:ABC-type Zn2+ transport system substrate-binding protein/surface adhesin